MENKAGTKVQKYDFTFPSKWKKITGVLFSKKIEG